MARRSSIASEVKTLAPAQRASCMSSRPIGPWPTTSTVSLGLMRACSTALRQVFTGSTNAASSARTPSGMRMVPSRTIQSIARTYSAMPPPDGSKPAVVPLRL